MKKSQLILYHRQILLPELGKHGQEQLIKARVLLVGLGGLGSAVAMYLVAAGIGNLILSDYDQVDLSNLQRQIIHHHNDVGRLKVESARDTLLKINPEVNLKMIAQVLDLTELIEVISNCDLVIDASDNFETRFNLNRACYKLQTPLISGAAQGMFGQVAVFLHQGNTSCYNCLYPDDGYQDETCTRYGVLAPLVGIIGSIQATEAIKIISNCGEPISGKLLLLNANNMEWRTLNINRDPNCPTCSLK